MQFNNNCEKKNLFQKKKNSLIKTIYMKMEFSVTKRMLIFTISRIPNLRRELIFYVLK